MNRAAQYDKASNKWAPMVERQGFPGAYRDMFDGLNLSVSGKTLCDLGTGCGDFAMALAASKGRLSALTLVDPSRAMLHQATTRLAPYCCNLKAEPCRLEELPTTRQYDVVLAAHVLEHCQDVHLAVSKMYSLLTPGGTLVLSVSKPHICQWLIWFRWQHRWYSKAEMRSLVTHTGFIAASCHAYPKGIPQRISLAYVARRPSQQG